MLAVAIAVIQAALLMMFLGRESISLRETIAVLLLTRLLEVAIASQERGHCEGDE